MLYKHLGLGVFFCFCCCVDAASFIPMVGRMELAVVLGLWIAGVGMLPSCIQPPAPRGGFLRCFLGSPSAGPYESSTALAGTWGGGDGPTAALHLGGPRRCSVGTPSAIKNATKTPVPSGSASSRVRVAPLGPQQHPEPRSSWCPSCCRSIPAAGWE